MYPDLVALRIADQGKAIVDLARAAVIQRVDLVIAEIHTRLRAMQTVVDVTGRQKHALRRKPLLEGGKPVATGGADNKVRIWKVHKQPDKPVDFLATLSGHDKAVNIVRFSPNGHYLMFYIFIQTYIYEYTQHYLI